MNYQILQDVYDISAAVYKYYYVENSMDVDDLEEGKKYLLFYKGYGGYYHVAPVHLKNFIQKYNFIQRFTSLEHCYLSVSRDEYLRTWFIARFV